MIFLSVPWRALQHSPTGFLCSTQPVHWSVFLRCWSPSISNFDFLNSSPGWEQKESCLFFFFFFRFERLRFSWRRFQLTAWSQQRGLSFRYKSIPHSSPSYWRQAKRRKKLEWVDGGFLKCHTLICQWCVLIPSGDAIDGAEGLKSTVEPAA